MPLAGDAISVEPVAVGDAVTLPTATCDRAFFVGCPLERLAKAEVGLAAGLANTVVDPHEA